MLKYLLVIGGFSLIGLSKSQCFDEVAARYVPKGCRQAEYDSTLRFIGERFDPLSKKKQDYIKTIYRKK